MKQPSALRTFALGVCVVAGCAVAFAAGVRAGALLQGTTNRSVSVAPTAPPAQAVAHNR